MAGELLIIVGAGPGISLATARRFGSEGFTVALIGRRGAGSVTYGFSVYGRDAPAASVVIRGWRA